MKQLYNLKLRDNGMRFNRRLNRTGEDEEVTKQKINGQSVWCARFLFLVVTVEYDFDYITLHRLS